MTTQEQLTIEKQEMSSGNPQKKKAKYFTKLQGMLLIFGTLFASLVGGYIVSDKYLWSNVDKNRINEQLSYYKQMVDADPSNPRHYVDLGFTYFLKGDNESAIKQFFAALDLDSNYYSAYLNLGIVYNDDERLNDALTQAQRAVDLSPRDYKGFLLLGSIYRKLEMYDEALASLENANTLMPTNTDIIFEIGKVMEEQGDFVAAEEIYKDTLNYDPLYKPAVEGLERIAANVKDNG